MEGGWFGGDSECGEWGGGGEVGRRRGVRVGARWGVVRKGGRESEEGWGGRGWRGEREGEGGGQWVEEGEGGRDGAWYGREG